MEDTPASLLVESTTPAKNHVFEVRDNRDPLGKVEAEMFYHLTTKLQ